MSDKENSGKGEVQNLASATLVFRKCVQYYTMILQDTEHTVSLVCVTYLMCALYDA